MERIAADVRSFRKADQGFVVYTVDVEFRGAAWSVERRFNDFDRLHHKLESTSSASTKAKLPGMPPKRFFGRFDPSFLTERHQDLRNVLDEIVSSVSVTESAALAEFLDVGAHVPWEYGGVGGAGGGEEEHTRQELVEQERLAALEAETAEVLIDVSRMGTQVPAERGELMAQREKMLRACDGFRSHAGHLKAHFKPSLPLSLESGGNAGNDSEGVLESMVRGPSIPVDVQRAVLDRMAMAAMDHLRGLGKVELGQDEPDNDLICHL